ncbi:ABC transporter permease [Rubinisphaera margarita]|uniref:ABC transporter permease n=1 Tax=Rubinisphaera margarita TaxID=2909586 RepID=UPI001EE92EBC|nr:ABC transporter permease [Rubinisphaera margarita]MCG6158231.1 ABC transporter permease [Rubinisphaera margarita]
MTFRSLVWKEILQRPAPTIAALLAVALGVAALVSVQSIASSSEAQVARQMNELGANLLVLPKSADLQDYYAADLHNETLPEEYVTTIILAQAVGVEEMAPKLCLPTSIDDQEVTLTGILPRTEFFQKSSWQSVDLMFQEMEQTELGSKHQNCTGRTCQLTSGDMRDLKSYAKTRVVHDLAPFSILVGADAARELELKEEDEVEILGETFTVAAVLPASGTVDDQRVFAHLHTVQDLSGMGPVVNVIEVMGCCEDVTDGLVAELEELLPDARVITISQLVEAQVSMNRLMSRLSYLLFAILMLVGGASIASVMFANVSERRREFGTLLALGATPGLLQRLVLMKASLIGIVGGAVGLLFGAVLAFVCGPMVVDVPLDLSLQAIGWGLASALVVAMLFSYFPARKAGHLDPSVCFQDL